MFFPGTKKTPIDRRKDVPYGQIVCDYKPQTDEPHRTRLVAGGDPISYTDDFSTRTTKSPQKKHSSISPYPQRVHDSCAETCKTSTQGQKLTDMSTTGYQ